MIRVTVITPPEPIITLAQAKRHIRVDGTYDDEYISDLIEVATSWLDGPGGWLGRALGEQTLEVSFPAGEDATCRAYPYQPLVSVTSETPSTDGRSAVVRYQAGYPDVDGKSTVPAPIRHAILLMVGHLYENRTPVSSAGGMAEMPFSVTALLSNLRVESF